MVAHEQQHTVPRLQPSRQQVCAKSGGAVGPLAVSGVQAVGFENGRALGALQGLALQQVGEVHGLDGGLYPAVTITRPKPGR